MQVQEVSGGSGFSAQNQRRLHYGLGDAAAVDRVVDPLAVGRQQTIEQPAIDQLHRVKEPHDVRHATSPTAGAIAPPRRFSRSTTASCRRSSSPASSIAAHLSFGILESYTRTGAGDRRRRSRAELVMGRLTYGALAAPGQRLHHRHQRRHPGAVAVSLAVRARAA